MIATDAPCWISKLVGWSAGREAPADDRYVLDTSLNARAVTVMDPRVITATEQPKPADKKSRKV